MRAERWQTIEELYHTASGLPDDQRDSFLKAACGEDESLLREIESLLRHGDTPKCILDSPAVAVMAKAIVVDELQSNTSFLEGKSVSHYRIIETIGRGGMGVIYKAKDLKLGRMVALKLLPDYLARDEQALQRFEREARAASALNHPNICTVYEIDEADGLHFISIELLQGETLKSRMAHGPLSIKEILEIARDVCHALEAAHSTGIVHRDIKPANIFLTLSSAAKVLDFGVAKRVGSELEKSRAETSFSVATNFDITLTIPGAQLGTAAYMSPEQAAGKSVDGRSDIFSLGAVLYEMATGQLPFRKDTAADLIRAIQDENPTPIIDVNRETSPALSRIVDKAMQKEPCLRYQTVAEMYVDLAALRSRLRTKINWRNAVLVPALITALLTLAVSASLRSPRARKWILEKPPSSTVQEIKSLAVLPLENLSGNMNQEYFVDGMTEALITNLAEIGSIRVISRTSAMHYKGTQKKLPEIAKELNVDAVIEGAVMNSGDRVRIDVQLIEADNDQRLWGKSYDRKISDILSLQSEVARAIVAEMRVNLASSEKKPPPTRAKAVNPRAYEAYLKGVYFRSREDADLEKAIMYFEKSVDLDPSYAPATLGLGDAYGMLAYLETGKIPPAEAWLKSEKYIARTLELDPNSSLAHTLLGMNKLIHHCDRAGAEKELNLAITLDPNDMASLDYHSYYLLLIGQPEQAIAEKRRVLENDPLSFGARSELGMYLANTGHTDEAIQQYQYTLELDPNDATTYLRLGMLYYQKGLYEKAVVYLKKALALEKRPRWLGNLGVVYAKAGKTIESLKVITELKEISRHQQVSPSQIARIYAALRDKDQAIAWLNKARKGDLPPSSDNEFAGLRSDPRFAVIEARLKPDAGCTY
jgi:serine/threonine protein kinase/TPR repeat protein